MILSIFLRLPKTPCLSGICVCGVLLAPLRKHCKFNSMFARSTANPLKLRIFIDTRMCNYSVLYLLYSMYILYHIYIYHVYI